MPEDEARYYDEEFRRGGIVVTVQARGRYDEARRILHEYGGRDASTQDGHLLVLERDLAPLPLLLRAAVRHQPQVGRRRAGPPLRLRVVRADPNVWHRRPTGEPPSRRCARSGAGAAARATTTPTATTFGAAGITVVAAPISATTIVTTWAPKARTRRRPAAAPSPAASLGALAGAAVGGPLGAAGWRGDRRHGRRDGRRCRRRDPARAARGHGGRAPRAHGRRPPRLAVRPRQASVSLEAVPAIVGAASLYSVPATYRGLGMMTVRPIRLFASCALVAVVAAGPAPRTAGAATPITSAVLAERRDRSSPRERPGSQVLAIDVAVRAGARYETEQTGERRPRSSRARCCSAPSAGRRGTRSSGRSPGGAASCR